jgi:hypothetical protein
VRREFYADLHRCACQCPGSGMTMFFPGQKPLRDGHGVHSLPPPSRMYVPFWQGMHWPARGIGLVERLGSRRHRPRRVQGDRNATIAPASARLPTENLADSARTLFFDKAEAGAVAAEELRTTDTSSRGPQRPRLHGSSWRNDCARTGGSVRLDCSRKHECEKTSASRRANQAVRIHPIGSAVAADKSLQRAATHLARYRDCARVARRSDRLHGKLLPQRAEQSAAISGAWRREILGTEAGKGVKEEGGSGSRGVGDRQKGRGRVGGATA